MFEDVKQRVLLARVEGALAVADLALERGALEDAARRYAEEGRALGRRPLGEPFLRVRAWVGVLRAGSALAARGGNLPGAISEAVEALGSVKRAELPGGWAPYDTSRAILVRLLAKQQEAQAEALAGLVAAWLPEDPRPKYALGRAKERRAARASGEERLGLASGALRAYEEAEAAAKAIGAARVWEEPLGLRRAAVCLRWLSEGEPGALARALGWVEGLDRRRVAALDPSDRLTVAQGWMRSARAMTRLRGLDLLEELVELDATRAAGLRVLLAHVEGMGWSFYPTEQDRLRGMLQRLRRAMGEGAARAALGCLERVAEVQAVLGREAAPDRAQLERLAERERAEGVGEAWWPAALAALSGLGWREALREVLAAHPPVRAAWRKEPRAWALGALQQRVSPDPGACLALLDALGAPALASAHGQAAVPLLLPALLERWKDWPELQPAARVAVERWLRLAPAPACGFAVVGLGFLALGEEGLALHAARRAQARVEAGERGAEPAMDELALGLARAALAAQRPQEAVAWLLPSVSGLG